MGLSVLGLQQSYNPTSSPTQPNLALLLRDDDDDDDDDDNNRWGDRLSQGQRGARVQGAAEKRQRRALLQLIR